MAILSILLLVITKILGDTQRAWQQTNTRIAQFREARRAFDVLKFNLSAANLNTYLRFRYDNSDNPYSPFRDNGDELVNAAPIGYTRFSELQFVCGPFDSLFASSPSGAPVTSGHGVFFQAPLGLSSEFVNSPTALNPKGYYVQFSDDANFIPSFVASRVPKKYRYRLMEFSAPTENNLIFDETTNDKQSDWFEELETWSRPIAENVAALYFSPRRPVQDDLNADPRALAPNYAYDTAKHPPTGDFPVEQFNQLPPQIDVVMLVLDEVSAQRLQDRFDASEPFNFTAFEDNRAEDDGFRQALTELETYLINQPEKINFRIFTSTIALRNSKWGSVSPGS